MKQAYYFLHIPLNKQFLLFWVDVDKKITEKKKKKNIIQPNFKCETHTSNFTMCGNEFKTGINTFRSIDLLKIGHHHISTTLKLPDSFLKFMVKV